MISIVTGKFKRLARKLRHPFGLFGGGKLAGASKLAGAGKLAVGGKLASANTLAGAGAGIGIGLKLFKLLPLVLPVGAVLLAILFLAGMIGAVVDGILSVVRKVWRWMVAEPLLSLLALASVLLLGAAGWMVFDHLQERRITIAAGSRTAESYTLALALKTVTARHFPRIRLVILEIEAAPGSAGTLEKGIIQLAAVPGGLPTGPSARTVAVLAGSQPRVLLARKDVDERAVYALTQVLMQRGQELAAAIPSRKNAPQALAINVREPDAKEKSDVPLHAGAAAFYDRDKTNFVLRHARISATVFAGLVLIALWIWGLNRRSRRPRTIPVAREFHPAEQSPWTFSRILLESVGEVTPPHTAHWPKPK